MLSEPTQPSVPSLSSYFPTPTLSDPTYPTSLLPTTSFHPTISVPTIPLPSSNNFSLLSSNNPGSSLLHSFPPSSAINPTLSCAILQQPNSTLSQTIQSSATNQFYPGKKSGKWSSAEDSLLLQIVPAYNERHWRKISQHIPGRTAIQCLHRWTKILKPGLVKGPWSIEEDEKLVFWVKSKGAIKWAQCARWIPGRSGKQCRERWFNNLNPDVKKGEWSPEEDGKIFSLYLKYGSSWSKIAGFFQDRTENSIKNRFYSTIRKMYSDQKKLEKELSGSAKKRTKKRIAKQDNETLRKQQLEFIEKKNTLYQLLKTSDVIHPEHIRKIYNSGIYRKNRRRKNNKKTTNTFTPKKIAPKKFQDDFFIMNPANNAHSFYERKNENNCNERLEEVLDREIEKEIFERTKKQDNLNQNCDEINIENLLNNEKINLLNEKGGMGEGNMQILMQQLQSLENLLSQTREELVDLENGLNNAKNELSFGDFGISKEEMELFGVENFEIFEDLEDS